MVDDDVGGCDNGSKVRQVQSSGGNVTDEVAKGVNFVFAKEYIQKTHGEDVWTRALERLPASQRKIWTGILVPFGDYSFTAFKSMVHAVSAEAGEQDEAALAKMYEYIADRSLNVM